MQGEKGSVGEEPILCRKAANRHEDAADALTWGREVCSLARCFFSPRGFQPVQFFCCGDGAGTTVFSRS